MPIQLPSEFKTWWGSNMFNGDSVPLLFWGARAIYPLDVPWDRRCWNGTLYQRLCVENETGGEGFDELKQTAEYKQLIAFHQKCWKELERWLKAHDPSSPDVFEKHEGRMHFRASPNASYGYVYCAAWIEQQPNPQPQPHDKNPIDKLKAPSRR